MQWLLLLKYIFVESHPCGVHKVKWIELNWNKISVDMTIGRGTNRENDDVSTRVVIAQVCRCLVKQHRIRIRYEESNSHKGKEMENNSSAKWIHNPCWPTIQKQSRSIPTVMDKHSPHRQRPKETDKTHIPLFAGKHYIFPSFFF